MIIMGLGIIAGLLVITAFIAHEWEILKHRERMHRKYRKRMKNLPRRTFR
jgi:hypothetical protein